MNDILLDGTADIARVYAGKDTIRFESDTGRASKLYRVNTVDYGDSNRDARRRPGSDRRHFRLGIHAAPVIVVIDAVGGRLKGKNAEVMDTASPTVVTLERPARRAQDQPIFDTIYLPDDTARASRTYRILDIAGQTVTLDGSPTLTVGLRAPVHAGTSPGVSGEVVDGANLGHGTQGWDQ